jgi:hypothetical protein
MWRKTVVRLGCADENNHRFGVAVAACCNVVAMVGHARILRLADWIK